MAKRTSRKAKRSSRKRTSRRNGYGRGYAADPRWISARFDGIDDEGNRVRKGDEVLYWPSTKRVQTGQKAKDAWRRFLSEKGDEEGTPYASNPRRKRASRRNGTRKQLRRNASEMPDEVRQLKEAIEANERASSAENGMESLPDPVYAKKNSDGSWSVLDNYERFFDTIYIYRDGQWSVREMYSDEPERPYSFARAMSDARIMYTG